MDSFLPLKFKNVETKFCFSTKESSKGSAVDVKGTVDKLDENFPPKVRRLFVQNLEIEKNVFCLFLFFYNVLQDSKIALLRSLPKNFPQMLDNFLQIKSKNDEKRCIFSTKPSKCSSVYVNCSSDNPAGNFLPEVWKNFAQRLEIERKNSFVLLHKKLLPKCSSGLLAVWQSYRKLSAKSLINFFLLVQKW